jgi:hypothetical protein
MSNRKRSIHSSSTTPAATSTPARAVAFTFDDLVPVMDRA